MKNIVNYIGTLCLALLLSIPVFSRSYAFRGLSAADGLSDLVVNAIYKDSLGYVWLGTGNSVERFDGINMKHYPVPGADEKLKRVNALAEMPGNELWMGNGNGLWRVSKEKDSLEPVARETIECAVRSLLPDGKGTLYIGTERGLFVYRRGTLEQVMIDPNMLSAANSIGGLDLGEDGTLWMATENGLYALRLADRKIEGYHNVVEEKHTCSFQHIARIGERLYLGTMGQGIISFDMRTKEFARFVDVGCNVISALSSDGKNLLYVGTDGNGVHFISTDTKQIVRSLRHETGKDDSLRSNSVYSLLVDREGLIWVGFYQLGLDYTLYQSGLFSTYAYAPFFDSADMPIRALAIRGKEKLIGSRDGLFYIDEENRRYKSFKVPQLRSNMIFTCLYYRDEYYIGTYGGGMYVLNPATLALRDFEPDGGMPFSKGHIFCIKQDHENQLWIGTSMGVFCYKDGKRVVHYTSANSKLPEGNVYEIYFDSTRKGWICTENGMCIWDPSARTLKADIFPEGFIHKEKVRVIYEDSNHDLYFFPDKGSLFISDLSMNRFRRLQPGTPLEGNDGMFVIEDDEKWLWLGTNNGLFRYDKKDRFIPYSFVDGLPGSVFTLCPPVCDAGGNFWFGNSKGLVHLDMGRLDSQPEAPYPVRVTGLYISGKPAALPVETMDDGTPRVKLEPSQRNVTFCFSDFSYTSPGFMAYEYRLEGEDEGWTAVTGQSHMTYYDLPSGSHTFRVRRTGQPDSESRMVVQIASGFGSWAVAGWALLLLAAGGGGYLYLSRRGRQQVAEPMPVAVAEPAPEAEQPATAEAKPVQEEKYRSFKVSREECIRLTEKLEAVMHREKPYMHSDLKIADLAAAIGVSAHTLSYLFNQHLERNYYDYINDYRIAEFKRLANKEEYARYTLSALAELCGFSSRASFFRYFKKATGITPNEYIRSIGKNNE